MSLLTVVRRANVLVGLRRPTVAAQAPDATSSAQMAEMARVSAEGFALRHDWNQITFDHVFMTVGAQAQPGALPDDFARFTFECQINGPSGPISGPTDKLNWAKLTNPPRVMSALVGAFRIAGGYLEIYPAPTAGQRFTFPYVTTNIYTDAGGAPKVSWENDTDICLIPETLIAQDVVARFLKAKGLDYGEDFRNTETLFQQLTGTEGGGRKAISVGRSRFSAEIYAYPGILGPPQ